MIARILPGKLIGEFVIDVRTIFESKGNQHTFGFLSQYNSITSIIHYSHYSILKGHVLANKWAVLIDPKKPLSGPQGYVRVDLAFLGKDEIPKVSVLIKSQRTFGFLAGK